MYFQTIFFHQGHIQLWQLPLVRHVKQEKQLFHLICRFQQCLYDTTADVICIVFEQFDDRLDDGDVDRISSMRLILIFKVRTELASADQGPHVLRLAWISY